MCADITDGITLDVERDDHAEVSVFNECALGLLEQINSCNDNVTGVVLEQE